MTAGHPPMKTILPDARVTPRFAGICTFCRFPPLTALPAGQPTPDWVVYGVPFDGGVTFRPGARFGPRAVRDASQYMKPFHLEHAVNICEKLSLADGGDAPCHPYSIPETQSAARAFALSLGTSETRLLAVGGDHSIAYANIAAAWERRGKPKGGLALVHIDSHLDTVDSVWGERSGHASVFIRAIEDGLIDPKAMISIGIKGPLNSGADLDYAGQRGITIVTPDRWRSTPGVVSDFVRALTGRPIYLTFDIDVVDPAFAPGTGTPSIGGLSSSEALALLRSLRGANLAGADVVEVLPDRDVAQITALLASQVIIEVLALDAATRT